MHKPIPNLGIPDPVIVDFEATDGSCEWWRFVWPDYRHSAVEALKAAVPSEFRDYDPLLKEWTIHDDYADDVADIVAGHFKARVEWVEVPK